MTRFQRELNEASSRMDALIAKVAAVGLAVILILQLLGK